MKPSSVEDALWLTRDMHNTLWKLKTARDEVALQVVKRQETLLGVLEGAHQAQETR